MKKIICLLCTIVLMMLGLFACDTEQQSSVNGEATTTVNDGDKKEPTTSSSTSTTVNPLNNKVFKLTLNHQGAEIVGTEQIYLKYNDGYYLDRGCKTEIGVKAGVFDCPMKQGNVFRGYYTQQNGKGMRIITENGYMDADLIYTEFEADATLYAKWETAELHTIAYNDNSGVINDNPTSYYENENVVLSDLSRIGYVFLGWFDKETGGKKVEGWNIGTNKTNVVLYAHWRAITWTVRFDVNGGSGSMPNQTFTFDVSQDLSVCNITAPDEMLFHSWNTGADGTGITYTDGQNVQNLTTTDGDIIVLYAQWVPKDSYRINYYNTLTAVNTNPMMFKESQNVTLKSLFVDGYIFGGWFDNEDCLGSAITGWSAGDRTDNVSLYAKWTIKNYSINYENINGADNSHNPTKYTVEDNVALSELTQDGRIFVGWYDAVNGGNKITGWNAGDNAENITVYARWSLRTYQIKYRNVKGATNPNATSFTIEDDIHLANISKTGLTFLGWYDEETGGNKITDWDAGDMTADVTVYGRWSVNQYVIRYNKNGGSGSMDDQNCVYDETVNIADCSYTPPNSWNMFSGWNTKADGTGTAYTVGQSVSNLTDTNNDTVILYAQWSNKTYNITYLDQGGLEFTGGFVGSYPTVHTFGIDTALVSPVRIGYDFSGWYIAAGCEGLSLTTLEGTVYNEDIVLYAKWTPYAYTVRYNSNGGTGSMSDQSMTYDVAVNLRANTFTKSGYRFGGWSLTPRSNTDQLGTYFNNANVKNLTNTSGITVTLYAVWIDAAFSNSVSIGQIVYDDGTVSSEYISGKTPIGIVFYSSEEIVKIVHISERSSLAWCLSTADGYKCNPATSTSDGSGNWQIICDAVSDEGTAGRYPAFEYVNGLGSGWYLPAKDELNAVYTNKTAINTALTILSTSGVSVTSLGTGWYCSSSSYDSYRAWFQRFSGGRQDYGSKDDQDSVRAVRAF